MIEYQRKPGKLESVCLKDGLKISMMQNELAGETCGDRKWLWIEVKP